MNRKFRIAESETSAIPTTLAHVAPAMTPNPARQTSRPRIRCTQPHDDALEVMK